MAESNGACEVTSPICLLRIGYGPMFDGPHNLAIGGRLTVIDLGQDVRGPIRR